MLPVEGTTNSKPPSSHCFGMRGWLLVWTRLGLGSSCFHDETTAYTVYHVAMVECETLPSVAVSVP